MVHTARNCLTAADTKAVVASRELTSPGAGVGAFGVPVNVGEASGAAPGSLTARNGAPGASEIMAEVTAVAPTGTLITQSGRFPLGTLLPAVIDSETRCWMTVACGVPSSFSPNRVWDGLAAL